MELKKWWHDKIVYQIYPKSFMDSNNDGVGDLRGIISKLDYLKDLGVDILWLTPFYKSPMEDNGYDVADYLTINELFGTNEDMYELIDECKKRDMYIMMDIVANHTSSQHNWFLESRKSKDNPYRDYYIWRDEPLHDMQSVFGGSAWEYDETTNQYYYHAFAKGQPDLNWSNPKVMEEIANCINFWLDRGVKGIRFDVIHCIGKDIDNNILDYGMELHPRVKQLKKLSFGKYDIVTVGEAWGDLAKAIDFTDPDNEEMDMVFQFECTSSTVDWSRFGKFTPKPVDMEFCKHTLAKYQYCLNERSWNALTVENHDLGRCVNKFGSLEYRVESAKAIATMNFLQKGTPYIYQGQEIGMTNIVMTDINDYDDVEVHGFYNEYVLKNKVMTYEEFLDGCNKEARDNNRTPMQWDSSVNAGFNKGAKTWLKVNPNYTEINVEAALNDPNSVLHYYRKLLALRKSEEYKEVFVYGKYDSVFEDMKNVYIYTRRIPGKKVCVVTNMRDNIEHVVLPFGIKKVLLANYNKEYSGKELTLSPFETVVFEVE